MGAEENKIEALEKKPAPVLQCTVVPDINKCYILYPRIN
jgi:hypothetical protein